MLRWVGLVALALAFTTACSGNVAPSVSPTSRQATPPNPTVAPTAIAFPNDDPVTVVLRLSVEPTMMPYPGNTVESPAIFSLFADGTAIYVDRVMADRDGTEISLRQAYLTEEQKDALLAFALGEGGLADARPNYPNASISDAGNSIFEIRASNLHKRVSVYALGFTDDVDADAAIRTKLEALGARLETFANDVANSDADDLGDYQPQAYSVTLDDPIPESDTSNAIDWPWPDLEPSNFLASPGSARTMMPPETRAVTQLPLDAPDDLMVAAPDGKVYLVRLRALLPDEYFCCLE